MAKIIKWNADKLIKRVPQILSNYGVLISPLLQDAIKANVYTWPTRTLQGGDIVTRRRNGEVVTSPRNIVDTGALLASQSTPQVSADTLRIIWTAPYSGDVLRGNYIVGRRNGSYIATPRDWISPVVAAQPPIQFFAREWRKLAIK